MLNELDFNPFEPEDLSSEAAFDGAVRAFGGIRTTERLGSDPRHKNADWLFPKRRVIAEHKELQATFSNAPSFEQAEFELRCDYARTGRANMFGAPYDRQAFAQEFIQLYRKPLRRVVEAASRQIRDTRSHLGWGASRGLMILSNRSLLELTPLAICIVVQDILTDLPSNIDAVAYVTNHYVDVPGSNLASVAWFPIYPNGRAVSRSLIRFVDDFGACFLRHLPVAKGDGHLPRPRYRLGTKEAEPVLRARPITPRRSRS